MKKLSILTAVLLALSLVAGCSKAPDKTLESTSPSATVEVTNPTEAKPTEPKPTEPKPTEAKPTEPKPTEAKPTEPKPTDPPHTHNYSNDVVVAPTCTDNGYTMHRCSCGDYYTDSSVPATGHSWGDWVTTTEATTSAEGVQTRTCSTCGATETQSIPKIEAAPLDYAAAAAYGNSYGVNTYSCTVDYSLGFDNAGYDFASCCEKDWIIANGGQTMLNQKMAEKVDVTAWSISTHHEDATGTGWRINSYCYEENGMIWFYVFYG